MPNFILLFTSDFEKAQGEVEAVGGRVTQKFTDHVFEASVPDDLDAKALERSSQCHPAGLDALSNLMANAWVSRQAKRS